MATKKIALIIGSSRTPRVGLPLGQVLHKHLAGVLPSSSTSTSTSSSSPSVSLEVLDIASHQLPYLNETIVPAHADASNPSASYTQPHTRAWSKLISSYSGFVILTPQYNWGIPGGLKNNIDYLFHEWTGKPVMVVSYGGRGGGKAAENLKGLCAGLRMQVVGKDAGVKDMELGDHVEFNLGAVEGAMGPASTEGVLVESVEGALEGDGSLGKARKLFGEVVEKVLEVKEKDNTLG